MRFILALAGLAATFVPVGAQPPGSIVFSEVMWMGSTGSNADEWIELFNRGSEEVDLSGWTITRLTQDGETAMLTIDDGKKLAPNATFLIANYSADDERSKLAAQPNLVNSSLTLANSKLQLRLYAGNPEQNSRLIDIVDDGKGAPMAGDVENKRAMVRVHFDKDGSLAESWATAQIAEGWDQDAKEYGTPGSLPDYLVPRQTSTSTQVQQSTWAWLKTDISGQ
ncbi:MAG: hypothetical protein GKR89_21340 [Candidatus Latescibacteria bacterium]|nr:hypothetical protein [Candidatus Latescibacterota bacterium]